MTNFHFRTWEINEIWTADIFANSDLISGSGDYSTEKEAAIAAQAFIDCIKFARGES